MLLAVVALLGACAPAAPDDPEASIPWMALAADERQSSVLYEAEGHIAQLLVLGDTALVVRERRSNIAPVVIARSPRRARSLGRFGGGPGELSFVGAIGITAGDSLLVLPRMPSMPSSVLSIETGAGRTLSHVPPPPSTAGEFFSAVEFVAVDSLGYAYGIRRSSTADDSIAIIRRRLRDGAQDTVQWLPTGEPDDARRSANGISVSSRGYYQRRNDWAVTGDGRVVLVNVSQYALTVLGPDRRVQATWRVPRPGVAVNDSAWEAHVRFRAERNPWLAAELRRRTPMPVELPEPATPEKPLTLPLVALQQGARSLVLDGDHVWIPVYRTDPPQGEHWERRRLSDGALHQRLSLSARHRLLAIAGVCAMVVHVDADEQQRLLAMSMPSTGGSTPCEW